MPNPYQTVPIRWDDKVKCKCFDMYMMGYTAAEIEKKLGVPAATQYGWSWLGNWKEIRKNSVIDYEARAEQLLGNTVSTLNKSIRTASKLLSHIEGRLDESTPSRVSKTTQKTMQEKLHPDSAPKQQSDSVPRETSQQSSLNPDDLATLASALKDSAEVMLRIFKK